MCSVGLHEEERIAHAELPRLLAHLTTQCRHHRAQHRLAELTGEGGVRRPDHADRETAGLEDGQRLLQVGAAQGVKDDVKAAEHVREISLGEVDYLVGAQVADPFDVLGVGSGGYIGTQILRQLDHGRTQSSSTSVHEHFLTCLDSGQIDEALPRCARDKRHGSCLRQSQ